MKLKAQGSGADPWKIDPDVEGEVETDLGVSLEAAFWEAAGQTASDAGSDLLESPFDWHRMRFQVQVFDEMQQRLREAGDTYRAPDGIVYFLEEDAPHRLDPPGCRCTSCLLGGSKPFDEATDEEKQLCAEGQIENATGRDLYIRTVVEMG